MNDIVIPEITITQQNLVNAVLLYLVCLLVVSVISKKRKWLIKNLWSKRTIYWLLGTFSIAVFLPAIWEAAKLVTGHSEILRKDLRSFAILFATIVGPAFIFWHTFIAQKQSYSSEQESITDRIAKAIADLGFDVDGANNSSDPNLETRLGAIYSLERIAQESLREHVRVMEILCAYVRGNSKASSANLLPDGIEPNIAKWRESIPSAETDIQAIIDVIARRKEAHVLKEVEENYVLDLSACNLQRVNFTEGKFDLALMNKSHFDFAKMSKAALGEVDFNQSTFNGAELNEAKLNGAVLNGAKLNGAKLNRAELNGAKLNGAELNDAVLSRAKLNKAVLIGAELNNADLNGAELNRAVLNGAELNGASLNGAVLKQAVLNRAKFNGAELNGAVLERAKLNRTVLVGADLNGANLDWADFNGAQMDLAAVKSTDLSVAINLSGKQVKSMFGDKSTTLIDDMDEMPKHWPTEDLDDLEFYQRREAFISASNDPLYSEQSLLHNPAQIKPLAVE